MLIQILSIRSQVITQTRTGIAAKRSFSAHRRSMVNCHWHSQQEIPTARTPVLPRLPNCLCIPQTSDSTVRLCGAILARNHCPLSYIRKHKCSKACKDVSTGMLMTTEHAVTRIEPYRTKSSVSSQGASFRDTTPRRGE